MTIVCCRPDDILVTNVYMYILLRTYTLLEYTIEAAIRCAVEARKRVGISEAAHRPMAGNRNRREGISLYALVPGTGNLFLVL